MTFEPPRPNSDAGAATSYGQWRDRVSSKDPVYWEYLGFEASAIRIRNFEPFFVPGQLQTPEYAGQVLRALVATDDVKPLTDLRIQRQQLLTRADPAQWHFIIDEGAISRQVGSSELMQAQVRHLLELAVAPNVTLAIVPRSSDLYPQMRTAYQLFEFGSGETVLYVEGPTGEEIVKESSPEQRPGLTPANYLSAFRATEKIALADATTKLLQAALRSFS